MAAEQGSESAPAAEADAGAGSEDEDDQQGQPLETAQAVAYGAGGERVRKVSRSSRDEALPCKPQSRPGAGDGSKHRS